MTPTIDTRKLTPAIAFNDDFHPESKVWVYISNRPLNDTQVELARQHLGIFSQKWTAHNQQLKAISEVFDNRFILLMVDETQAGASGCSIDASVHFVERLGQELGVDLFERQLFGLVSDQNIEVLSRAELEEKAVNGQIQADTLTINTLADTRQKLKEEWLVEFNKSWFKRLV